MKYRIVSGTSLAVAVIALAMNGASVTPASAKKAARDRKQRVQRPEFLQGPWLAAGQVGTGLRGERRHGRLIASRAGGRLYRTDAVSIGRLLGFAAREIPRADAPEVTSDASAVRYSFCEDNRMERPSSLGFGGGYRIFSDAA
jgi:hypothetical protein